MKQQHLPIGGIEELKRKYANLIENNEEIRILDVGFGTGTNTLAILEHVRKTFGNNKLVIYGIDNDKYLLDYLDKQKLEEIHPEQNKILSSLAKHRVFEANNLKIRLLDGELVSSIESLPSGFNYVFYDMFGPYNNKLWDEDIFTRLHKKLSDDGKLVTHTRATDVRINLVRAGFDVSDGPEYAKNMKGTIARKI